MEGKNIYTTLPATMANLTILFFILNYFFRWSFFEWLTIIGVICSILSLSLLFNIWYSFKATKYWNVLKENNLNNHIYKGCGVEVNIDTTLSIFDLFDNLDKSYKDVKKVQNAMNKQMNMVPSFSSGWEYRVIGLNNLMIDIQIHLSQLEVKVLQELVKLSPTPELIARLEIKESRLSELAIKTVKYD